MLNTQLLTQTFAGFLASLVENDDEKDTIDEATEDGISAINEAVDEYQPDDLISSRMSRIKRAML